MPCGHPCGAVCHSGECPNIGKCEKKVSVRCKCRRKKKDFLCKEVKGGKKLECDDICQQEKERKKKVRMSYAGKISINRIETGIGQHWQEKEFTSR